MERSLVDVSKTIFLREFFLSGFITKFDFY